ncbi:MAG: chromosome segregation protein SMC [Firmicutes bacterium]|nr:chromosome segregation protein SMC [Candidatus Fermentithermobacillaceae bacterium]
MLKSLTLHGFKSFYHRTSLSLSPGVTAIVGPNGCGKSNLVDALRWVLGEQNPKVLRCDSSQDVIFSGTERKKAMGMAEVKLLMETPDGSELEITRRLTRDGESSYEMNGVPCRWRDIIKATGAMGLSYSGYMVIGQGVIHELAGGHAEDRRQWVEEAAGVAAFRMEKRETERRLEQIDVELTRLDDLLVELEARRAELEEACRIARRYRELMASRRELEAGTWLWDLDHARRKLQNLAKKLSDAEASLKEAEAKVRELESSRACLEREISSTKEIEQVTSAEREKISRTLVELTRRRDGLGGMVEALGREIEGRTARCRALAESAQKLAREKEEVLQRRDQLLPKRDLLLEQIDKIEREKKAREREAGALRDKIVALRQNTVALVEKIRETQEKRDARRAEVERLRAQVLSLETEISGATRSIQMSRARQQELQDEVDAISGELRSLREEFERCARAVEDLTEQVKNASEKERATRAELSRVSARVRILADLEKVHEGLGKGTRTVLDAAARGVLRGIVGAVAELLSCDKEYIPALAAALGGSVENVVVEDEMAARRAIELLRKEKAGRVTFLPLDLLRPRDLPEEARRASVQVRGVRPLMDVISYPREIEKAVKYLVGRVVLAENMDTGLEFMRKAGWSCRVVTLSGESLEPGGSISGGDAPRHAQVFERKQELLSLREEERRLAAALEAWARRAGELEAMRAKALQERDSHKAQIQAAEAKLTALTDEIARLSRVVADEEEKVRRLTEELAAKKEALSRAENLFRESASEEAVLENELDRAWTELRRYEEELREKDAQEATASVWEKLTREREILEAEVAALNRRLESIEVEMNSVRRTLSEEQAELCRLLEEKEDLVKKHGDLQTSIDELDRRVRELNGKLVSMRSSVEEKERAFGELVNEIYHIKRDAAEASSRMEEMRAEISSQTQEVQRISVVLRKEYGIDPDSSGHIRRYSRNEALSIIEGIDAEIRSLGQPNLRAEEEYDALSRRISEYLKEKDQALKTKEELLRIKELAEREMERRFRETFEEVRSNFREIFAELFGGGKGDLRLTDDEKGIEVIAQPPGSRGRSFMLLSGGERSLTGLALIFSLIKTRPSPFVVLDEVDTALDEANVLRFGEFVRRLSRDTQFLVITHQKPTIEVADVVYGVTMDEPGVSKVLGIRLEAV